MIISLSKKFVFVHIHKTGGESVTSAIAPHLGLFDVAIGLPNEPYNDTNKLRLKRFGLSKHSTAAEIRAALGAEEWPAWKSFAVVRDPGLRLHSLYNYLQTIRRRATPSLRQRLMGRRVDRAREPWTWSDMRALEESGDFSGFIRHPLIGQTSGTRPQFASVSVDGRIIVDRVLRLETLARDWRDLCDWLGAPAPDLPHVNRSESGVISQADAAYLRELYREDYETFGD